MKERYEGDENYYYRQLKASGINVEEIKKAGPTLTELHDLFVGLRHLVKRYREIIKEENAAGMI